MVTTGKHSDRQTCTVKPAYCSTHPSIASGCFVAHDTIQYSIVVICEVQYVGPIDSEVKFGNVSLLQYLPTLLLLLDRLAPRRRGGGRPEPNLTL